MDKKIEGYDLIRSFAILVVFLGHSLKHSTNEVFWLAIRSLSPGLTMSLLGFISAVLLSARDYDFGSFLIKRFTRVYISLILCLIVILSLHALLGKKVMELSHSGHVMAQHTLLHVMGLSAFFELFEVENKVTIGAGLWFITAIILMYLVFPLLQKLFRHTHGLVHLFFFVTLCTVLNFTMSGTQSFWNVVISFAVGVYCGVNGHTKRLIEMRIVFPLLCCIGLLIIAALSTAHVLPYWIRGLLFAFYPLTFVPFLFAFSKKLPTPIVTASSLFAGLSYEFYILHFYFIGDAFKDFFEYPIPLYGRVIIAFVVTFVLAYVISKGASWLRKVADKYLLANS